MATVIICDECKKQLEGNYDHIKLKTQIFLRGNPNSANVETDLCLECYEKRNSGHVYKPIEELDNE